MTSPPPKPYPIAVNRLPAAPTPLPTRSSLETDQRQSLDNGITSRHWLADGCLILTAVMWGINIPIVKYAVGQADPFAFNAIRLVFATLILGVFSTIEQKRNRGITGPYSRWRWLTFALLNGFAYMVLFMLGVPRTTAGNVALLLSSMPVWTAVFSFLFLGERLRSITWAGLAITICGTLIVILFGKNEVNLGSTYLLGNVIMLVAAMTWAASTVVSKKLLETVGPMTMAFWSAMMTTPLHLLMSGPAIAQAWPDLMQPGIILAILYSGLGSTGLAYALWHVGVRQLGGSHAAAYQNLVTLVAVLGGWIFLAESPLLSQIAGGALIICGVITMRRGREKR